MCRDRWKPTSRHADDGQTIRLVVYRGEGVAAVVVLDPARAIGLAGRLIEAGHRHLEQTQPPAAAIAS